MTGSNDKDGGIEIVSSETFDLGDGRVLTNVHSEAGCEGQWCVIHHPKPSHTSEWPLHWRGDRAIFERICPHGIGHPDPSQLDYWEARGQSYNAIHGCCGCCETKEEEE